MAATLRRRDDHAGHYGGRESASEQNREYKEWTRQRRSRTACDGLNSAALDQDVAARIDSQPALLEGVRSCGEGAEALEERKPQKEKLNQHEGSIQKGEEESWREAAEAAPVLCGPRPMAGDFVQQTGLAGRGSAVSIRDPG
ncbi:unnamed protein product [Heligmosomoides polygyrus]|uniref:Uncharacterized protein n=1 Tax=Heligmosomoides polygyrus TaxID=6339 RepID=A0A183GHZ3_HELPZ|nr:unnamed protein product [Heligmosomoides polygyrus]